MTAPRVYLANAEAVTRDLSMTDAIALMRRAFLALAHGRIDQPLRTIVRSPLSAGFLGLMPASVNDPEIYPSPVYGAKVGTLFPNNPGLGKDPHQGCIVLLSGATGETLAILDASSVTALRTAAVTGLATDLLAHPDAGRLTLFGAGHQASCQLQAVSEVRPLQEVRVVSGHADSARRFVQAEQHRYAFPLTAVDDVETAVRAADIIVTATNSRTPVFRGEWLQAGTHVTAMGSSTPASCEIDGQGMQRSRLFVDLAASTRAESGEYRNALASGHITDATPLTELAELVAGKAVGRENSQDITLFKSLGLALEDVVVAAALCRRHEITGHGVAVEL